MAGPRVQTIFARRVTGPTLIGTDHLVVTLTGAGMKNSVTSRYSRHTMVVNRHLAGQGGAAPDEDTAGGDTTDG
ncbi:hypothetical protein GCM10010485_21330 [Streptosporangium carneum]